MFDEYNYFHSIVLFFRNTSIFKKRNGLFFLLMYSCFYVNIFYI